MNRTEYANAVRDLLDLNIDFSKELPVDDTGYGFDNIADVLTVSPTLMDRYINVAGKIARLATGLASRSLSPPTTECPKTCSKTGSASLVQRTRQRRSAAGFARRRFFQILRAL